eukprot:465452_1
MDVDDPSRKLNFDEYSDAHTPKKKPRPQTEQPESTHLEVFLRIRPTHESKLSTAEYTLSNENKSIRLSSPNQSDIRNYSFDYIFDQNTTNTQVFDKIGKIAINRFLSGYSNLIFSYGITGSGKTHTIFGYKKENVPGMYQLFSRQLFDRLVHTSSDIFIEIRFCELYQGKVYDLLSGDKRECFVREDINGVVHIRAEPVKCDDGKIRAYPINNVHVQTEDELLKVIISGISSRNVGNSTLHDKSSRSHAFLEFEIVSTELTNERKKLVEIEASILQLDMIMDSTGQKKLLEKKYKKRGQEIPAAKLKMLEMVDGLRKGRTLRELEKEKSAHEKEKKLVMNNLYNLCNDSNREYIGGTVVFVDLAGNE